MRAAKDKSLLRRNYLPTKLASIFDVLLQEQPRT